MPLLAACLLNPSVSRRETWGQALLAGMATVRWVLPSAPVPGLEQPPPVPVVEGGSQGAGRSPVVEDILRVVRSQDRDRRHLVVVRDILAGLRRGIRAVGRGGIPVRPDTPAVRDRDNLAVVLWGLVQAGVRLVLASRKSYCLLLKVG